jgi:TfoX/Sxy family transcriptional regulator of competence genes
MAYSEILADRIRERFLEKKIENIEEKSMMGGLAFMINEKMCVGVIGDDLMCRLDPAVYESCIEETGCRPMDFTGKPMKGWIFVDYNGMQQQKDLDKWIELALDFNVKAKKSIKKSKK